MLHHSFRFIQIYLVFFFAMELFTCHLCPLLSGSYRRHSVFRSMSRVLRPSCNDITWMFYFSSLDQEIASPPSREVASDSHWPFSSCFSLSGYLTLCSLLLSALCPCKTLFGGSTTCFYSNSLLLVRSLPSPLHVGEQSMGPFSGVLHSCGHRKVLTWHSPNPLLLFYLKKIIITLFTEYLNTVTCALP